MWSLRQACWLSASVMIAGAAVALVMPTVGSAQPGSAAHLFEAGIRPGRIGEIDCNGLSPIQRPVKANLVCADSRGPYDGRAYDNGHYTGHDEPSVRFISSRPGSGNNVTITETLPLDPAARPTVKTPGHDVTHWFELSNAPWFSTAVCDPNSVPLRPCTPRSDANAPHGRYPGAGAALVELQFYPPGMAPFVDNISCNDTQWCSALNIDSRECQGGNCACFEPANFAYVQINGVPTGPPGPQTADLATVTPNAHTLLMNPGDRVTVRIWDAKIPGGHALEVRETDLTTGRSGFMIASARNGFMHTNPVTCNGTPFNFQPEYNTARAQNIVPWTEGPYMINSEYEIGHWEACTSVTGRATLTDGSFKDTYYKHCAGPYETAPDARNSVEQLEPLCYRKGDIHDGTAAPNLVTGCAPAFGDLDYDGSPYWADWPHSVQPGPFPAPFLQQQPTSAGHRYSQIQFLTNSSATQPTCHLRTGQGCVLPPKGAHFYPHFTLAKVGGTCVWEYGNMPNGNTFGGDKQYGQVRPANHGAFAGSVRRNPSC